MAGHGSTGMWAAHGGRCYVLRGHGKVRFRCGFGWVLVCQLRSGGIVGCEAMRVLPGTGGMSLVWLEAVGRKKTRMHSARACVRTTVLQTWKSKGIDKKGCL